MEPRKPMDRTKADALLAVLLGLAAMVVTMTWWLRGGLLAVTLALAADFLWRSPWTIKFRPPIRFLLILLTVAVVLAASWNSLATQYKAEGGISSFTDWTAWFFGSEYFRLFLAMVAGALIGNQFAPARPRLPRRSGVSRVKKWLSPGDALGQFCDPAILQHAVECLSASEAAKKAYEEKYAELQKEAEDQFSTFFLDPKLEPFRQAADRANSAYFTARSEAFGDLVVKLKNGEIVARGLPFESEKLDGVDWEVITASVPSGKWLEFGVARSPIT